MHFLHKILVHIPRDIIDSGFTHEDLLTYASFCRSGELEEYEKTAYEMGYDFSAGRWEDIYPEEAYLASDNLEWFLAELEEVLEFQKSHIDRFLKSLTESLGSDLNGIVEKLWNHAQYNSEGARINSDLCAYDLYSLGQLLKGCYRYDSHFYNIERRTARLYPSDIERIKQNPEEWALYMLDYYE